MDIGRLSSGKSTHVHFADESERVATVGGDHGSFLVSQNGAGNSQKGAGLAACFGLEHSGHPSEPGWPV